MALRGCPQGGCRWADGSGPSQLVISTKDGALSPEFLAQVESYRDKPAERTTSLTARQEALDGFLKAAGQGA